MPGGEPTLKVSETANDAPCTLFVCIFFFFGVSVRVCESLIVLMRKRYKTERKRKESYSNRGFKTTIHKCETREFGGTQM